MGTPSSTRAALHLLMQRGAAAPLSDNEFNALALAVFEHQFQHNPPYRGYCERRHRTPTNISDWREIPAVPTAAFKEVSLVAGQPGADALTFRTSGTTRGRERRGAHVVIDPGLYDDSLLATFRAFVLPDRDRMQMISLAPPAHETPDSSLNYMITRVLQELSQSALCVAHIEKGIDMSALRSALESTSQPVCLLGTSLAYLHMLDALADTRFELPAGSRLMDTGGFKGEQREITAPELRARYDEQLGIKDTACVNEYGMTELCSQYYDRALREQVPGEPRVKKGPPWLRARIVHPETLEPMPRGEVGILQHFDLANLNSVSAVLTEDLAYEQDGGFVLLGRAPGAQPRGCSIAMDILLQDVQRR